MIIGVLSVRLLIHESMSLKDKRRVLKSLIERIKNRYNVSIAETGLMDSWSSSELGISCTTNESGHADSIMNAVVNFIESRGNVELAEVHTEIITYRKP